MRLIDADALVDALYEKEYSLLCPLDEVSEVVNDAPTVDAVEVVHGRWVKKGDLFECSVCKEYAGRFSWLHNYCPNCGADMRDGGAP